MFLKFLEILTCICIGKFLNFKEIKNDISINIININIDKDFDFDFEFIFNYLDFLRNSYDLTKGEMCLSLLENKSIIINTDFENIHDYIPICDKYINEMNDFHMYIIILIYCVLCLFIWLIHFKVIKF